MTDDRALTIDAERPLFVIWPDGTVQFGPGMTLDGAARAFWGAVQATNPIAALTTRAEAAEARLALAERVVEAVRLFNFHTARDLVTALDADRPGATETAGGEEP